MALTNGTIKINFQHKNDPKAYINNIIDLTSERENNIVNNIFHIITNVLFYFLFFFSYPNNVPTYYGIVCVPCLYTTPNSNDGNNILIESHLHNIMLIQKFRCSSIVI